MKYLGYRECLGYKKYMYIYIYVFIILFLISLGWGGERGDSLVSVTVLVKCLVGREKR